ncbi:hypothetical protein HMI54_003750 [Coelomomyces lativittatus]|nr:hypothetical protein HMI56_001112 [Coelomomyces lativittatus]KAJ1507855.1 hypothetical protein HMI54_003750 [Coelomomyces lativittatus]
MVPVGNLENWRSPHQFYRQHPRIRLRRIPTLMHWTKSGPSINCLIENDCKSKEKVMEFLTSVQLESLESSS